MNGYDIPLDRVFAEAYLSALIQGRRGLARSSSRLNLADLPEREGRLKEARSALLEMQAGGVQLTALCQNILQYVKQAGL